MPTMFRSVCPLALALSLSVPACKPPRSELARVESQLAQIQATQGDLGDRMQRLEDRELIMMQEHEAELAELESLLINLAARLGEAEDGLQAQARREAEQKERRAKRNVNRPDPDVRYRVDLGDAPTRGSAKALVTIVIWSDFQCPYCNRVRATLKEVERMYRGKVRFAYKHNPLGFHPRAMPAALASMAAHRQGKFWAMHDLLFENQKQLTDENFVVLARELGLKVSRFNKDLKDPDLRAKIQADQAQGQTLGARGTPAFFINGKFLSGAQPTSKFEQVIDAELKAARALVSKGVSRKKVYAELMQDATPPPF